MNNFNKIKQSLLLLMALIVIFPKDTNAQDNGAAIAAGVGALAAIGAGVAAVEQMKERAELTATQWLLANHPEINNFSLKTIDFDGEKIKGFIRCFSHYL